MDMLRDEIDAVWYGVDLGEGTREIGATQTGLRVRLRQGREQNRRTAEHMPGPFSFP